MKGENSGLMKKMFLEKIRKSVYFGCYSTIILFGKKQGFFSIPYILVYKDL